jgi:hypothetical protein
MKYLRGLILVVSTGCAQALPAATADHSPSLPPPASPTSTPATFGSADLPRIVLSEDQLGPGMTLDDLITGRDALVQPVALLERSTFADQRGFVDARMTIIGTSGQSSYWEEGGYVTWTAVYASGSDAEAAVDVLIKEHESETGWGMERVGRAPYGDEGVSLEGAAYGFERNLLHIWRRDNLLLAALAIGVTATRDDAEERLGSIAEGMATRAG